MKKVNIFIVLIGLFSFVGCGEQAESDTRKANIKTIDPTEASVENFKNILQSYYNKKENCIRLEAPYNNIKFPFTLVLERLDNRHAHNNKIYDKENKKKIAKYDFLVQAGILTVEDGTIMKEHRSFSGKKTQKEHKTKVYTLTKKGLENYEEGKEEVSYLIGAKRASWCVAKYQVDDVVNFTKPSNMMGMTISKANYLISPIYVLEWTKDEKLQESFHIKHQLKIGQKKSTDLILMNDGWKHNKEAKF